MGTEHLFAGTLKNLLIFTLVGSELEGKALGVGEEVKRILESRASSSFTGLHCTFCLLSHRESERI